MNKLLLLLLFVTNISMARDSNIIYYPFGTPALTFVPYLKNDSIGILKPGNDGLNAANEVEQNPNSFLLFPSVMVTNSNDVLDIYDRPYTKLELIGRIGYNSSALVVSKKSPYNDINSLINHYKNSNDRLKIGEQGPTCNLVRHWFLDTHNIKVDCIRYKPGGVQYMADLMNGETNAAILFGPDIINQYNQNKITIILKFTPSQAGILKEIPYADDFRYPILLYTSKNTDQNVKNNMIQALSDITYLNKMKEIEDSTLMNFSTSFNLVDILKEQNEKYIKYKSYLKKEKN